MCKYYQIDDILHLDECLYVSEHQLEDALDILTYYLDCFDLDVIEDDINIDEAKFKHSTEMLKYMAHHVDKFQGVGRITYYTFEGGYIKCRYINLR